MLRKPLIVSRGAGGLVPLGAHLWVSQRAAAGSRKEPREQVHQWEAWASDLAPGSQLVSHLAGVVRRAWRTVSEVCRGSRTTSPLLYIPHPSPAGQWSSHSLQSLQQGAMAAFSLKSMQKEVLLDGDGEWQGHSLTETFPVLAVKVLHPRKLPLPLAKQGGLVTPTGWMDLGSSCLYSEARKILGPVILCFVRLSQSPSRHPRCHTFWSFGNPALYFESRIPVSDLLVR